jgi:hypothetical protein
LVCGTSKIQYINTIWSSFTIIWHPSLIFGNKATTPVFKANWWLEIEIKKYPIDACHFTFYTSWWYYCYSTLCSDWFFDIRLECTFLLKNGKTSFIGTSLVLQITNCLSGYTKIYEHKRHNYATPCFGTYFPILRLSPNHPFFMTWHMNQLDIHTVGLGFN